MISKYSILKEERNIFLLKAIKFWLVNDTKEDHQAFKNAVEAYATRCKIDLNRGRLPVIWLRMFFEVRSECYDKKLPEIDPKALNRLLNLEQKRQAKDNFLLYQEVHPANNKRRGPIRQRTPNKRLIGRTTLEILHSPPRQQEASQCWPYDLNWSAVIRSRSIKRAGTKSDVDSYKSKWGKLAPMIEKCLSAEFKRQKNDKDTAILILSKTTESRIYRSTVTTQSLAEHLSKNYIEISSYSLASVKRVLPCFVTTPRGRPKNSLKDQQ